MRTKLPRKHRDVVLFGATSGGPKGSRFEGILPNLRRRYDEGSWTVQAIVEHKGATLKSAPVQIALARPAKGDKEQSPVDRLHHTPWSNYTTNAFCGDCFDLVVGSSAGALNGAALLGRATLSATSAAVSAQPIT